MVVGGHLRAQPGDDLTEDRRVVSGDIAHVNGAAGYLPQGTEAFRLPAVL
jgi:hypothetical protein